MTEGKPGGMRDLGEILLPIATAYTGISCANCNKAKSVSVNLQSCGGCKKAMYCSRSCQVEDWKEWHKDECKVLKQVQKSYTDEHNTYSLVATSDLLDGWVDEWEANGIVSFKQKGRALTMARASKFVAQNRICTICLRNDFQDFDFEWHNCEKCNFGWCCSKDHWKKYKPMHTKSICDAHVWCMKVGSFHFNHQKKYDEPFVSQHDTLMTKPFKKFPKDWDEYFRARDPQTFMMARRGNLPAEFLPACTKEFSIVVSILYAMYKFAGAELLGHFLKLEKLTIDVFQPMPEQCYEAMPSAVWEEVLHVLPKVKELRYALIGPEAKITGADPGSFSNVGTCPECVKKGRTRSYKFTPLVYHEYVKSPYFHGKPDIIVSYNKNIFHGKEEGWEKSVRTQVEMDVFTVWTCFCLDDATNLHRYLQAMGANILTAEGPVLNPFRDQCPLFELQLHKDRRDIFYNFSMYVVVFKGWS